LSPFGWDWAPWWLWHPKNIVRDVAKLFSRLGDTQTATIVAQWVRLWRERAEMGERPNHPRQGVKGTHDPVNALRVPPADRPTLHNWKTLSPEERWWLRTMMLATTSQATQTGMGSRKALRELLGNAQLSPGV
jgi:hypothetical protein